MPPFGGRFGPGRQVVMTPALAQVAQAALQQAQSIVDTAQAKPEVAPFVKQKQDLQAQIDDTTKELVSLRQQMTELDQKLNVLLGSDAVNAQEVIEAVKSAIVAPETPVT